MTRKIPNDNRNCLSFWFPKIEAAGLPVPRTIIVKMPTEVQEQIFRVFDTEEPAKEIIDPWFEELGRACEAIGYPVFMRTGLTSGKHEWEDTCALKRPERLRRQVFSLIEHSEIVDMLGLRWDVWALREFLPTEPIGFCQAYHKMPICQEFRFFAADGKLICWHPYWPEVALDRGRPLYFEGAPPYEAFIDLPESEFKQLAAIAEEASRVVGGAWSIDLLATKRGWVLTDMAEADRSWHWPGCSKT